MSTIEIFRETVRAAFVVASKLEDHLVFWEDQAEIYDVVACRLSFVSTVPESETTDFCPNPDGTLQRDFQATDLLTVQATFSSISHDVTEDSIALAYRSRNRMFHVLTTEALEDVKLIDLPGEVRISNRDGDGRVIQYAYYEATFRAVTAEIDEEPIEVIESIEIAGCFPDEEFKDNITKV